MKKKLFLFITIFTLLLLPKNVSALSYTGIQTFYWDGNGTSQNNNTTSTATWGAYSVIYNNVAFGGGSFSNIPNVIYGKFPSGLGCSKKNCIVKGIIVAYTPNGVGNNNLLSALNVELETNGAYKSCSITDLQSEYGVYNYATFQCANYNVNTGFNVVIGNLATLSSKVSYFGIAPSDFQILDNLTADDIIVNASANTQNIINSLSSNISSVLSSLSSNQSQSNYYSEQIINSQNTNSYNIIQNQNANQQQTNQKLDNINSSVNDDTTDSQFQDSTMNNINSQLASNNVISDLLLLPVNMYQNILNSVNGTCTPFNLGSLFGTNLVMPCIQPQSYLGSSLYSVIDILFCGFFILAIRKKFVDIFNNMTNLKNGGNEIE